VILTGLNRETSFEMFRETLFVPRSQNQEVIYFFILSSRFKSLMIERFTKKSNEKNPKMSMWILLCTNIIIKLFFSKCFSYSEQ